MRVIDDDHQRRLLGETQHQPKQSLDDPAGC